MSHQGARPGPGPVRHAEGSSCMDIGWVWEKVETTPYFVVQGVAVWPHLGPWLVSQVSGCRISRCGGGGGQPGWGARAGGAGGAPPQPKMPGE